RDDHHVTRSIGKSVQDNEAMLAAMNDVRLGVVAGLHRIAEDAASRFFCSGDIGVAPRGPEVVHSQGQGTRWRADPGTRASCRAIAAPPSQASTIVGGVCTAIRTPDCTGRER